MKDMEITDAEELVGEDDPPKRPNVTMRMRLLFQQLQVHQKAHGGHMFNFKDVEMWRKASSIRRLVEVSGASVREMEKFALLLLLSLLCKASAASSTQFVLCSPLCLLCGCGSHSVCDLRCILLRVPTRKRLL